MSGGYTQALFAVVLTVCTGLQAAVVMDYATVLEKGYQYVDPRPESEYVAPETRLLIRLADDAATDLWNWSDIVSVEGHRSGPHTGKTTLASDGETIVFVPTTPFAPNEAVDVTVSPLLYRPATEQIEPIQYRFYVLRPASAPRPAIAATTAKTRTVKGQASAQARLDDGPIPGQPSIMGNGVSVPSDFPHLYVTQNRHPGDGYLFLDYPRDTHYALIVDNTGAPVWYRRGKGAEDFKVQKNGMITETQYTGYDQNFNRLKDFHATNGYNTDSHELQVLEDGGYLLLGLRTIENVDMSQVVDGGKPNATMHETCVQEFTAADELIFQWRAWENYDIASIGPKDAEDVRASSVRVTHLNAIDVDRDGHLLVSSRHLSQVTKIDRQTGQVLWRLGGPNSDFIFVDDPLGGFSCQHDVRAVGSRRYTVFDNGNDHDPPVSRAVEYLLDPNNMTATLVWEYRASPDRYAYYQGNAQRLPNGNTLINFALADYPKVTEVNATGEIEFEMDFLGGGVTAYRVFRFPWTGVVERPYLIVESNFDRVTLLFNKFGDRNTAYYRIYGGLDPHPETIITTSDKTLLHLTDLKNDQRYYFRVTAVDVNGRESEFSNETDTLVYFYDPHEPGENMVRNGDFSGTSRDWTLLRGESTDATWTVESGSAHVTINDGGPTQSSIRLVQDGMKLFQGETYVLEFDAGADAPRLMEVSVNKKNVGSFWNYSKMGAVFLPTARQSLIMKHFTHTFVMDRQTDLDACVEVKLGADNADVYLDNVSLVRQAR
ncbi:MAG: aryl-sulfate sulfotransferase [Phycisphaerales bacterium]|nr:MAG: aryl-sulfate sulfotransferase [Phycisphaerales bacterium]